MRLSESGEYAPVLAASVPTPANGGVSADLKTITFKLRPGIKWSDGNPFTSADVKFTWEIVTNKANKVTSTRGLDKIASIETPDDLTVIVKLNEVYAPYLTLFPIVLPKHVLGALPSQDMNQAPYNRVPVGTGPFKVTEWLAGDHITVEKNPYYRETGKPLLDKIVFKVVPSRDAGLAQLRSGDVDVLWNLAEAQTPDLEKDASIKLWTAPTQTVEQLFLNLSKDGDPNMPHPVLGDVRVRQALELAIDKKLIVDQLLYSKAEVATAEPPSGWAHDSSLKPSAYDPARANALLDEAGWRRGQSGIREREGVLARLTISSTAGDSLRERVELVLKDMLAKVGIEIVVQNLPSNVIFGSYQEQVPRQTGKFDILMYTAGPGLTEPAGDPHNYLVLYYHSGKIPPNGWNYTRIVDAKIDQALNDAASTIELEKRKAAYAAFSRRAQEIVSHVYLYNKVTINAFRKEIQGWKVNQFDSEVWDATNWTTTRSR